MMYQADLAIVGGGVIGLATAYRYLERFPGERVLILEKESRLAVHQTGRNSGVLHSGIYYKPGSLRALNCRQGKMAMEAFCEKEGVAYDVCGKVIVAIEDSEMRRLENIFARGQANGVECEMIGAERLRELEPHVAGIGGIHVLEAGIVDYVGVCEKLGEKIREAGAEILLNAKVTAVDEREGSVVVKSTAGDVETKRLVTCAGLHSDRLTKMTGQKRPAKIVPFRGEYYELKPEFEKFCKNLIYPVPNPQFPFLGVHFTRMAVGGVECGPNAVLAFSREGYSKLNINLRDLFESLTYPGFLRLATRNWKMGLGEMWRSFSKKAFVKTLKRLIPEIRPEHIIFSPPGIRAQALKRDGNLVEDFLIQDSARVVNVCNAPSPAATAALNVGNMIVDKIQERK